MNQGHGLNLEKELQEQSEKDWEFGAASLKCLAEIPEEERENYLPKGEVQKGVEDMMDCATRGPLNILETKFNWLLRNKKLSFENEFWLKQNGYVKLHNALYEVEFSDAFVAINSGTTRNGNSLKAPLEAIRKQGLIPKYKLPLGSWMTWEDYHNPARITENMRQLGQEFIERFTINYERVFETGFETLLQKDLLDVAGYAWPDLIKGEYSFTEIPPNHIFVGIKLPQTYIFDNYEEIAGDFIKKLASDYNFFEYGYRIFITAERKQILTGQENIIENHRVLPWWKRLWGYWSNETMK